MTETAQPTASPAPLDPRQLLLPAMAAMASDVAQLLPPADAMQAMQAQQVLQQLGNASRVLGLQGLAAFMQGLRAPLQQLSAGGEPLPGKTGELLALAARDAQRFVQALEGDEPTSPHTLFPSYRALIKLGGKDTAHPADLWDDPWPQPWLPAPEDVPALTPSVALRAVWDQHTLALLQASSLSSCQPLRAASLGLAAHAQDGTVWQLAAAWLDSLEQELLELDIYAKRLASRLLSYYASYAKDQPAPPPALLRDLQFFCAQALACATQRGASLPPTLTRVQQHCAPGAEAPPPDVDTASADAPVSPPPAPAPVAPPPPSLPAFQAAPEILPTASLGQGLASTAQIEPDLAFLQEAELLSQELEARITAWRADPASALHPDTDALAQALSHLAWSSGCTEIASLAHLLQRCLQRMPAQASPAQRQSCQHASDEMRRLLHQFAAGFLRRAHPQVMEALHQLYASLPVPSTPQDALPAAAGTAPDAQAQDDTTAAADTDTPPQTTAAADALAEPAVEAAHAAPVLDAMHFSVFEEEMLAVWPRLQAALKQWLQTPTDSAARQTVLRCLHTLKGSARLAGAMAWASQVHALEGLALEVQSEAGPRGPASLQPPLEALRIAFVALQQEMADRHPERLAQRWQHNPLDTVTRHAQALWATHDAGSSALAASQLSLHALASGLQQLRHHIKDCAAWADTLVLHGDLELPYEWHEELHALVQALDRCTDDADTVHQQLQHSLADTHNALNTQGGHLRALQHTLLYARLVPLSHWQERLDSCVQLAAQDTAKAVELVWQDGEALLERSVADALTPALEHLLRNCVAHGLETPAQRSAAGKPETGRIQLSVHSQGTQQILRLQDDGRGLDVPAIRSKAQALGLLPADAVVDNDRAAALILHPGLSTATAVTELAGRGIGMDVVADTIAQLGGSLRISSTAGQGCCFDICLPAPPQVEQVLALRAGSWRVALPARALESVRRVPAAVAEQALAQGMLNDEATGPLPLYWAGAVWQQSARSLEPALDGTRSLLIVRSDTARWGLLVDEILGTQEVTLQAPAELAVPVPGLLGIAAQPSGQVLQVYDPAAVLGAHEARQLAQQSHAAPPPSSAAEPLRPLVLLADDSLSVRRLAQHLLQSSGYRVETAEDGLQALHTLENGEVPALLIADIEMPDMDGLELLRRLRATERFQRLPVVMLTAHSAGPVSHQAIDLGAQAFLTKPYSPNELLAVVRRFVQIP